MSLSRDFVLAPATPRARAAGATPAPEREPSILVADSFRTLLASFHDGVDFGPYTATKATPAAQLASRRWLRVAFLLSQFRTEAHQYMDGLWWLDAPHPNLGGLTPFAATADDETFARAHALTFLTGGRPLEAGSRDAQRFRDFCDSPGPIGTALTTAHDSLLCKVFRALWDCTGSLTTARLMLTCGSLLDRPDKTLYRMLHDSDAATCDHILRATFGYTGERLDEPQAT